MKLEDLKIITEYFDNSLYEMSNYDSKETGLPDNVKLWVRTEPGEHGHNKYRIKLEHPQKGSAVFPLWGINTKPEQITGDWKLTGKELKSIQQLLHLTHKEIQQHIDGEISSFELGKVFDSIKDKI